MAHIHNKEYSLGYSLAEDPSTAVEPGNSSLADHNAMLSSYLPEDALHLSQQSVLFRIV